MKLIARVKECIADEKRWPGEFNRWRALRYIFSTEKQRLAREMEARRKLRAWVTKHAGPSEKKLAESLSQPPPYPDCRLVTWLDGSDDDPAFVLRVNPGKEESS
jgi:hypothetical protein